MGKIPIITVLFAFSIVSCQQQKEQEKPKEDVLQDAPVQPAHTPSIFVFAAVTYTEEDYNQTRRNKVVVSEVQEVYSVTEEQEYRLLDDVTNSPRVRTAYKPEITERKFYKFQTYRQASEKRQEVLKSGIN